MDLSTIRKKLDGGEYDTAQNFYDDFKLMIRNCFIFNPSGTPVNFAGQELQKLFDDKWKSLPPLQAQEASDDEEEEEEDSDEERRGMHIYSYSFRCANIVVLFLLRSCHRDDGKSD